MITARSFLLNRRSKRIASDYDQQPDRMTPTETLVDRHLAAVEALAETTVTTTTVQQEQVALFRQALAQGDKDAAYQARDAMWRALYTMYKAVYDLADAWNDFTARTADDKSFLTE